VPREHKPPRHLTSTSTESDPGFESQFLDYSTFGSGIPDVCQIAPKMLWIHYFVDINHFGECCENQPVTIRNADKSPIIAYSTTAREVEK